MQLYWKCEECDETNAYPDVKFCETCGAPMTAAAEQRVLREKEEEEKRQAQLKLEEERRRQEMERARKEAERKAKEAREAARRAELERQRLAELERKLAQKAAREAKFGSFYTKFTKFFSISFRTLAAVAAVLSVVLIVMNFGRMSFRPVFESVSYNIRTEYLAHTIVSDDGIDFDFDDADRDSRVLTKVGDRLSVTTRGVFSNLGDQARYIADNYTPLRNTINLVNYIVDFLSESV